MGYDFAMTSLLGRTSKATPLNKGQAQKNDIREERQLKTFMKGLTIWETNLFAPMKQEKQGKGSLR